jgi:hypothetical protein
MGKEPILAFLSLKFAIFSFRGYNLCQIFIWGYAEGVQHDLGVRKYQKVENPCNKTQR